MSKLTDLLFGKSNKRAELIRAIMEIQDECTSRHDYTDCPNCPDFVNHRCVWTLCHMNNPCNWDPYPLIQLDEDNHNWRETDDYQGIPKKL